MADDVTEATGPDTAPARAVALTSAELCAMLALMPGSPIVPAVPNLFLLPVGDDLGAAIPHGLASLSVRGYIRDPGPDAEPALVDEAAGVAIAIGSATGCVRIIAQFAGEAATAEVATVSRFAPLVARPAPFGSWLVPPAPVPIDELVVDRVRVALADPDCSLVAVELATTADRGAVDQLILERRGADAFDGRQGVWLPGPDPDASAVELDPLGRLDAAAALDEVADLVSAIADDAIPEHTAEQITV